MCQYPSDGEDKYTKANGKIDSDLKYHRKLGVDKQPVYLPIYLVVMGVFALREGIYDFEMAWKFAMLQLEILGLLMIRKEIRSRKSVSGISGMTFVMQAVVFFVRLFWCLKFEAYPNFASAFCSLLLVLDILKSIFVTHHDTYDAESDGLKAWYIIPVCFAVALPVRLTLLPSLEGTAAPNYLLSAIMYVDALTLMPQVHMMAKSDGKVEAPVANFVAATAIARCGDLISTLFLVHVADTVNNFECFRLWMVGDLDELASTLVFSWILCVLVHIVQMILVCDFLYYFVKARLRALKESQDVSLFIV